MSARTASWYRHRVNSLAISLLASRSRSTAFLSPYWSMFASFGPAKPKSWPAFSCSISTTMIANSSASGARKSRRNRRNRNRVILLLSPNSPQSHRMRHTRHLHPRGRRPSTGRRTSRRARSLRQFARDPVQPLWALRHTACSEPRFASRPCSSSETALRHITSRVHWKVPTRAAPPRRGLRTFRRVSRIWAPRNPLLTRRPRRRRQARGPRNQQTLLRTRLLPRLPHKQV